MAYILKNVLLLALLALSLSAFGQDFRFEDLTQEDVRDIMEDVSGLTAHTTASGAAPLGENVGFELGFLASYANTPNVERLVNNEDQDYSYLPNLGILGRIGMAKVFVLEGIYLPSTDLGDYNIQITSLAAQINILKGEPFNLAVKGYRTDARITYDQIVDELDVFVELDNIITGAQILASKKFGIVEPFFGLGRINHDGEINATGEGTIFDIVDVTATSSVDAEGGSSHIFGGFEFDFPFFNFGIEASRLYDNNRYSAKITMGY